MSSNGGSPQNQRLDSWKEIAAYLRRDERTAIRWEKDRGLPVYRVPGGKRQAVFAYPVELDAWLRQDAGLGNGNGPPAQQPPQGLKPTSFVDANGTAEAVPFPIRTAGRHFSASSEPVSFPPAPRTSAANPESVLVQRHAFLYGVIGAVVVAFVVAGLLWARRGSAKANGVPVRAAFTLNSLQAFDAEGKVLWSYTLPGVADPEGLANGQRLDDGVRIADFRGDGDNEVLALLRLRVGANATRINHMEVDMFSRQGKLLWSYVPHRHLVFSTHDLQDNWSVLDILVAGGQKKQIWVAVDHAVWGHAFVVSLDPDTGKDTLRYVNSGTLFVLSEMTTPRGNFVLAGGFNNEYDSGSLVVIDESKTFAVSPQSEGTSHKCLNCAKGDPDYYFVFPRSEVNDISGFYHDQVVGMQVMERQIELSKKETGWNNNGPQSLYVLDREGPIRPVSVAFNTDYDLQHRQYEREGKLDHGIQNCPERLHPRPIKMWTPSSGWTTVQLPPPPLTNDLRTAYLPNRFASYVKSTRPSR